MRLYRRGDEGEPVRDIQRRLTGLGFPVDADGAYGERTVAAVTQFQASRGVPAPTGSSQASAGIPGYVDSYLFGDSDDREWEADVAGFGRVFPHSFGDGTSPYFTTWLTLSPAGDRLVLDFAKEALVNEQLGADETQ